METPELSPMASISSISMIKRGARKKLKWWDCRGILKWKGFSMHAVALTSDFQFLSKKPPEPHKL